MAYNIGGLLLHLRILEYGRPTLDKLLKYQSNEPGPNNISRPTLVFPVAFNRVSK